MQWCKDEEEYIPAAFEAHAFQFLSRQNELELRGKRTKTRMSKRKELRLTCKVELD